MNNRLNSYTDGIITYVFDNKTKKLKSTNIQQYRIFYLADAGNQKRKYPHGIPAAHCTFPVLNM